MNLLQLWSYRLAILFSLYIKVIKKTNWSIGAIIYQIISASMLNFAWIGPKWVYPPLWSYSMLIWLFFRYHLTGSKKGKFEVVVDGLPGAPDNLKTDKQGNIYVHLVMSRDDESLPKAVLNHGKYPLARKFIARVMALTQSGLTVIDSFFPHPLLKKAIHAVSNKEWCWKITSGKFRSEMKFEFFPKLWNGKCYWFKRLFFQFQVGHCETLVMFLPASRRVTVVKLNKNGAIVESLHATDGRISGISEIEFVDDYIYLGSPFNNYLARVKVTK